VSSRSSEGQGHLKVKVKVAYVIGKALSLVSVICDFFLNTTVILLCARTGILPCFYELKNGLFYHPWFTNCTKVWYTAINQPWFTNCTKVWYTALLMDII